MAGRLQVGASLPNGVDLWQGDAASLRARFRRYTIPWYPTLAPGVGLTGPGLPPRRRRPAFQGLRMVSWLGPVRACERRLERAGIVSTSSGEDACVGPLAMTLFSSQQCWDDKNNVGSVPTLLGAPNT